MKLKRNDLVKDFELIVKQEIKNHNDSVLASNLAINKLNERVLELTKSLDRQINKLDSKTINLTYEFENILDSYNKIHEDFVKLKNDQITLNERNHVEIEIIDKSVETVHQNQPNVQKSLNKFNEYFIDLKYEFNQFKKAHELERDRMKLHIRYGLIKLKEDMLSQPSDAVKIKEELMEQISMHKIDNEGLIKEVHAVKKVSFIQEKKIENLYMLIDRLKNKKDLSN